MKKSLLLLVLMLLPLVASADYTVEIDGIYYILKPTTEEAEVTSNPNKYTGDVVIPETVTYNGTEYSVTSIGESAFSSCVRLTTVTIGNSVTSIDSYAFAWCSSLTSVTIPNSVTSIGNCAFGGCWSLTSVTIPNSLTSIGSYAFEYCSSLTSVTIPNSVTSIDKSVFSGCRALISVTIPNSVTYIGTSAFSSCSSLTSVTIGCGIGTIGSIAFANCQNLTDVYCHAERVPSTSADVFENSNIENAALHVPTASISAYKAAEPWKNFKNIVALDGSTPETQKCATPTISYENGRLTFDCETDDVEFIYNVVPAPGVSGKGNDVEIKPMFTVSVYATKTGYENSEVATKEISIEGGSGLKGDVNGDGEVGIGDIISITNIMSIRP